MKKFRRISIIIVLLVLTTFLLTYILNAATTYKCEDPTKIVGVEWSSTGYTRKTYDLDEVEEVSVIQIPEGSTEDADAILNQPNVYCVEPGINVGTNPFEVGAKLDVKDPIIAYILADGAAETTLEDEWMDIHQLALWIHIYESGYKNDDIDNLKNEKLSYENYPDTMNEDTYKKAQEYYEEVTKYVSVMYTKLKIENLEIKGGKATFNCQTFGMFDTDKLYINGTEVDESKVTITTEKEAGKEKTIVTVDVSYITTSEIKIKVERNIKKPESWYRILKCDKQQTLLVGAGKFKSEKIEAEETIEISTKVSLQKYITHVNGTELASLSDETTTLKDRKNRLTVEDKEEPKVKEKISGENAEKNEVDSADKKYKKGKDKEAENAVKINIKDKVTYKIEVYNNSKIAATNVKIRDQLPLEVEDSKFKLISIYKDEDITTNIKDEWKKVEDGSYNTYEYVIPKLEAGKSTYFEITVEFIEYKEGVLTNTAWVYDTTPKNSTEDYRIEDRDYVKMNNPFKVSLEKYISEVNGVKITDTREGNAEHGYDDDTSTNNDTKQKNPVTVYTGDKVTYTIKVKNDGAIPVTITEIKDTLPNGVECALDDNKDKEVIFTDVEVTKDGTTKTKLNETQLSPSESVYFTIEVKVIESSLSMEILKNVAEITEIEGGAVQDHTLNNNKDADYIQLGSTPVVPKTSYTVIKNWDVSTTTKPAQVTVKLFKVESGNEIDLGLESVVLSDANDWSYTWDNLDKGITYIARELNEAGTEVVKDDHLYNLYTTTNYTIEENKVTITNIYNHPSVTPDPITNETSYTVEKVWDDDNNPDRPKQVTVKLYEVKDGELVEVEGSAKKLKTDNWTYTWNKLPKYYVKGSEEKELIVYTAREIGSDDKEIIESGKLGDYTVNYLHSGNKTTITNKKDTPPPSSDLTISGIVWNDKALDKTASSYNGKKDEQETGISGVKVMLYREGKGVVAETDTDHEGKYYFSDESLEDNTELAENEKFIKGPKVSETDIWAGTYYSYYVIFEYDGITYTSTSYTDFTSNDSLNSNAKENEKTRESFNSTFGVINNASGIKYSPTNEDGYIPQSIHKYDEATMKIQSSTSLIKLENYVYDVDLVQKIKHINLGLKGRDVFDLELTSDVDNVKVTVNGVPGEYNYSNKVTVRREDVNGYNYLEDSANPYMQGSYYEGGSYDQKIRTTDIGDTTGLGIQVTYKITVKNASKTPGTATKIINYYDDAYTCVGAYTSAGNIPDDDIKDGDSGSGYKSKIIPTPGTILNQSETMEIYIVYTLNNAANTLNGITDKMATYNMAEIFEYKTEAAASAPESTRGLIDKDSAPGSANTEDVRLYPDLVKTGQSTVEYYFNKKLEENKDNNNYLKILKYEDDTYATPTLYFVKDGSQRTLTGIVFEDLTTVDSGSRIKTGNGILDTDKGEVGIYGATVKLIEITGSGPVVRDTKTTLADNPDTDENELGTFKFSGFLPGNYMIEYHYGDTVKTALLGQAEGNIEINKQSYNGEDYQATNNTGSYGSEKLRYDDLGTNQKYWYVFNEDKGISTATDDVVRRNEVSSKIVLMAKENPEELEILNDIRDYIGDYDSSTDTLTATHKWDSSKTRVEEELVGENEQITGINGIIEATKMNAETKSFLVSVEETTVSEEGEIKQATEFNRNYTISNMNFGIAEVPVTTVDLKKFVSGFTITDSTGSNILAKAGIVDGKWTLEQGTALYLKPENEEVMDPTIDVSLEDEKLQGARLEITYTISKDTYTEKNFDETSVAAKANITGLVDFVDNNLSYNEALGDNASHWDVISEEDLKSQMESLSGSIYNGKATTKSVVLGDETGKYNTILKLRETDRFFNLMEGTESVTITLEKVLSSTNSTIDQLLEEVVDASVYSNTVEITNWDYPGVTDRIRTSDRHIILPGISESASETSEILVIHPPTGTNFNILYLVIAVISLAILAGGIFGIKKFVIKK